MPSPPRLTFGGQPRPPVGLIQQRPVGPPGNLSGVVNIIPRQNISKIENGSGPKVLSGIRPPSSISSPSNSPPGPLQSKVLDGPGLPSSHQTLRALNKSHTSVSKTPPTFAESSPKLFLPQTPVSASSVMGIKNLTPIESTSRMPNLRPVQVQNKAIR
jgi:hypothetical protein